MEWTTATGRVHADIDYYQTASGRRDDFWHLLRNWEATTEDLVVWGLGLYRQRGQGGRIGGEIAGSKRRAAESRLEHIDIALPGNHVRIGCEISPRPPVPERRRTPVIKRLLMLSAALALLSFMLTAPPAYADKQTDIHAKVKDSLVYLEVTANAWVEVPPEYLPGRAPHERRFGPIEAKWSCSGFAVDRSGYIVTAGHCVDPANPQTKHVIRTKFIHQMKQQGKLVASVPEDVYASNACQEQWPVFGEDVGSPMQVNVSVMQAGGPGPVIDKLTTARVADFQNSNSGDNALLKVHGMPPLKPLAIAQQAPHPGQRLTAVGFPAGVGEVLDPHRLPQPSFNAGTASGQQVSPTGTPTIEINADVSPGMSGGPTVNSDTGEVLGVNSEGTVNRKQAFNFITDAATLRDFLHKNNIHLGPTKPFPWVWVVAGVVTAAVVATLVVLALLGRRKGRRPQAPIQGGPQPSQQAD
jgi:serine protease Do